MYKLEIFTNNILVYKDKIYGRLKKKFHDFELGIYKKFKF